ncbi:MFS transporter [Dyadobacter sp. LHD-138]|uniref:spinster family MFS transporter n=1 Tax=Dyadobacter sp. LHD-138 TaxID=3071413 RepID=UPI0027DF756E|nr:MFS transporter [Dyadobacter sp. LHD-138]MDQ6481003.1 MFS transporter [Dyadobacter sp. LHD-138]
MKAEKLLESKPSTYAWTVVALLCLVGCLNYLDRMMITTMRSSIIDAIPMSDTQFGLLTSVFLWIYGLLSPAAGFLADRFSRSKVIIGSLFVWSLVTWLTSQVTTFEELLATRALMGVSEACYIPAALALIMDYHPEKTKSLAAGIHMGGVMIGQSLGFVGGWLAENHSWNFAFTIFGGFGIIYSVILVLTLKDPVKGANGAIAAVDKSRDIGFRNAVRALFTQRAYVLAILYWSLISIVGWVVVGWLPTYFKEHFSLSQSAAGVYSTGYFHAASLAGVLLGGYLADRWSRRNPRARILVPLYGLLIGAPAIFLASNTAVLSVAIACFMLFALTRTFSDANMMPILSMIVDARYRATAYGILNMFSCIVGGLGIYAGGWLRDAQVDLSLMFKVASGIMLLCTVVLWYIKIGNNGQINSNESKI